MSNCNLSFPDVSFLLKRSGSRANWFGAVVLLLERPRVLRHIRFAVAVFRKWNGFIDLFKFLLRNRISSHFGTFGRI